MENFNSVIDAVKEAGKRALKLQREVVREYKNDGSVLTEADLEINKTLTDSIKSSFPEANIIAEEQETPFSAGEEWTFTIDPIDGTDSYSQGMPGWCVAVGIHDRELQPVGGIVSAPRWGSDPEHGLFLYHLPEGENGITGIDIEPGSLYPHASSLVVGSKVHRRYDYGSYPGKIRSVGSSILHALSPLIHPDTAAAFLSPAFIWDISPAHGIVRSRGIEVIYPDGEELTYRTMVHRKRSDHYILIAQAGKADRILQHFLRREIP
ncbi:MAG: inositol monophosphatase family protein [Spirochaetaceae bacterium]